MSCISLNDSQLLRYSRNILLPEVGIEGQTRIASACVLVVGAGGLGCAAALYLGAAGVGRLLIADGDTVELGNLQRQIGHSQDALGRNKATSLAQSVRAINSEIEVIALPSRLEGDAFLQAVAGSDIVLDASDNFPTRHALNRACVEAGKPLVSGAALGFSGQLAVFAPAQAESPCYHCLYPDQDEHAPNCVEAGVFSPLVGIIGAAQAMEALKWLTQAGQTLIGRLLVWEGLTGETRVLKVPRDPACAVCAARAPR